MASSSRSQLWLERGKHIPVYQNNYNQSSSFDSFWDYITLNLNMKYNIICIFFLHVPGPPGLHTKFTLQRQLCLYTDPLPCPRPFCSALNETLVPRKLSTTFSGEGVSVCVPGLRAWGQLALEKGRRGEEALSKLLIFNQTYTPPMFPNSPFFN